MQEGLSYLFLFFFFSFLLFPSDKASSSNLKLLQRQAGADNEGKVKTLRNRERLKSRGVRTK